MEGKHILIMSDGGQGRHHLIMSIKSLPYSNFAKSSIA